MSSLWCAISGHGFGHAAQVVPVLNELGRRDPSLKVLLRTTVPEHFFANRLTIPWELSCHEQDVGCVQQDPLSIDVFETWKAYENFHDRWDERIFSECEAIKKCNPDLILSNISYLALEAGSRVGLPTIACGSLSWDEVLQEFVDPQNPRHSHVIGHIREVYKLADLAIRLAPSLPLDAFSRHVDVGPIGYADVISSNTLSCQVAQPGEGPLVLVAFGGIPLESLPFERLDQLSPYQFLLDLSFSGDYERVRSTSDMYRSFTELFRAADIILTKPGYGTVIEAVAIGKPLVYVRRCNFADEEVVVEYARQYGRAYELSKDDFFSGFWRRALDKVQTLPVSLERPPESGLTAAADIIESYLLR